MEDLIPVETVLADMESDCGIVAEAAKDYLDIHYDEYRDGMNALYKSLKAINKKVIKREIPEERRADVQSLRDLEKGIAARIAENEAMLNRSIVNATKEGTE